MRVVKVNPGICGYITELKVVSTENNYNYEVTIETECPHIVDFKNDLTTFNLLDETRNVFGQKIRDISLKHIRGSCIGCLIPPGILKAAQADAGLALAANADIQFIED